MRVSFRRVKDVAARPVHWAVKCLARMPGPAQRAVLGAATRLAECSYFVPGSHVRKSVENLCAVSGRADPLWVAQKMFGNVGRVLQLYALLLREGSESVARHVEVMAESLRRVERVREEYGTGILLVPHCTGGVLSVALVARILPVVVMVRESKSPRRWEILREYFGRLAPEVIEVRSTPPAVVARRILLALRERKLIIGTTDLIRKTEDTVEVKVFGQSAWMPGWPARFAARRKVPLIPAYCRVCDGRVVLMCDEPYLASDVTLATQRWASYFEGCFRRYPEDWPFMLEKRWSRLLAAARAEREGVQSV